MAYLLFVLTDQQRQEDEIFVLQNIFSSNEFRCIKGKNIECSFSINCNLISDNLLIDYDLQATGKKILISFLPPIRFYIQLPQNYPSIRCPEFFLSISWLPPWEVSLICQKLDEIWQTNKYNEIIFNWLEFLKNEVLIYLNLTVVLDITYLLCFFLNPNNPYLLEVLKWTDARVIYGGLDLNPIEKLLEYDKLSNLFQFDNSMQECSICLLTYIGKMCIEINQCKHVFCKDCILVFIKMKIDERNVNHIKCPAFNCKENLKFDQIKEICSLDLFQKYEKYIMEIKLISSKNLVYCPRKVCQTPVITKTGENLASCPKCEYNFCAFCFKVYHGVMACQMSSIEKLKLINEYVRGNNNSKKNLEKRYGKQQIQQIVEKQLTDDYLKENTKICPTCGILTTKILGCNLMSCLRCFENFCWLCNSKIISEDPYDHFKSFAKGPCSGCLYEGVDESNDFDLEYFDIEY